MHSITLYIILVIVFKLVWCDYFKKEKPFCQRYSMSVSFKEIGWDDWVVAPDGFDAYFCSGDCSLSRIQELNRTSHGTVKAILHNIKPDSISSLCCVPTELAPLSMVVKDDVRNSSIVKIFEDMIVLKCGCK